MKLRKVISGGQTGADQTGVEAASLLGLATGGTTTRGCRTDDGPNPDWCKRYGLAESASSDYPTRTKQNVKDADITVWFGTVTSPGYKCTKKAAEYYGKPFVANPVESQFRLIAFAYETMNVAGNRARKNFKVVEQVKTAFDWLGEAR